MDERLASILRRGLQCLYNADEITDDEFFSALGYIADNEEK